MNIILNTHNEEDIDCVGCGGNHHTGLSIARDQFLLEDLLGQPRSNPGDYDIQCWDIQIICPEDGEMPPFQIYQRYEDDEYFRAACKDVSALWKFLDHVESKRLPIVKRA